MPWTYHQGTGALFDPQGKKFATGYAGTGKGRNNPDMEAVRMVGPLPRGRWKMVGVKDSARTGPLTIVLEPEPGTNTHGRSEFRVHGNNVENDASNGCIILPRGIRVAMWNSPDKIIEVVP